MNGFPLFPNDPRSGAEFSVDRVYRYKLWRHWGGEKERLMSTISIPLSADACPLRSPGTAPAWWWSTCSR
jgi:hypothetical protein